MRRPLMFVVGLALAGSLPAQGLPPFTLPSQCEVTQVNGVAAPESGPIRTSSRNVAARFSTDAVPAFQWLVAPTGTTGGSALFPNGPDEVAVLLPFGQENQAFEVRLCITAIAPSQVLTNANRTFCGQGLPVALDTEPPTITVSAIEIDGQRQAVTPSSQVRVNGPFTLFGSVRDNLTQPPDISVTVSMGGNETSVTPDPTGLFEAQVDVSNLADGSYELQITAEDVMDDGTPGNTATLTMN